MMEVGQLLRQTREAQELSLADIEEKTKIRQSFISALESGDWDDLPNEVVARGFLRKYAVALGLNPDELLSQASGSQPVLVDQPMGASETTSAAQTATATQSVAYQPINLDLYDVTPESSHRLRRVLGFLLALIPVAILAYLLIQFGLPLLLDQSAGLTANPTATATLPPAGTPATTPLIVVGGDLTSTPAATDAPNKTPNQPTDTPESSATATPTPTPQPSPTPTATPISQLTMQLEIVERAWVRVTVDGEAQLESLLDPGYTQEFVAQESIQLRTGNAAGVILTLNGEQLPPLGETAEVVDLIWAIEDDEIVVMTPTAEPEPTGSPTSTPEPDTTGTPTVEPALTATPTATAEATETPTAEPDTPTPEPPTPEPQDTETPPPGA